MSAGLLIIVILILALWLLLIRPQRKRQAEQAHAIASLEEGDEVVTAGGIYGTVEAIDEDEIRLEIAPDTTVRVAKRAIAAVLTDHEDELETDEIEEIEEPEEPEPKHDPQQASLP